MNATEFSKWYRGHVAAFLGIDDWLNRTAPNQKSLEGGASASKADVLKVWKEILEDVPFDKCVAATKAMARGDEPVPVGFSEHPRAVRALAKKLAAGGKPEPFGPKQIRSEDGRGWEDTFKCPLCRDYGLVDVIHPKSIEHFRNGTYFTEGVDRQGQPRKGRRLMTMPVRCACAAGQRRPHTMGPVYDAEHDLLSQNSTEADDAAIEQFVEREQGVF